MKKMNLIIIMAFILFVVSVSVAPQDKEYKPLEGLTILLSRLTPLSELEPGKNIECLFECKVNGLPKNYPSDVPVEAAISTVNNIDISGQTSFQFPCVDGYVCSTYFSITLPEKDTCGIHIEYSGGIIWGHDHFFVTGESDTVKYFHGDPRDPGVYREEMSHDEWLAREAERLRIEDSIKLANPPELNKVTQGRTFLPEDSAFAMTLSKEDQIKLDQDESHGKKKNR